MKPDTPGRPLVGMYSFRTADPERLATFWAEVMELPVSGPTSADLVMLDFHHEIGPITWMFERDDSAGSGSSRLGLDIGLPDGHDWRAIADRAERAGATRHAEHDTDGVRWIEMADPDGNRFRVFAPRPS